MSIQLYRYLKLQNLSSSSNLITKWRGSGRYCSPPSFKYQNEFSQHNAMDHIIIFSIVENPTLDRPQVQ